MSRPSPPHLHQPIEYLRRGSSWVGQNDLDHQGNVHVYRQLQAGDRHLLDWLVGTLHVGHNDVSVLFFHIFILFFAGCCEFYFFTSLTNKQTCPVVFSGFWIVKILYSGTLAFTSFITHAATKIGSNLVSEESAEFLFLKVSGVISR